MFEHRRRGFGRIRFGRRRVRAVGHHSGRRPQGPALSVRRGAEQNPEIQSGHQRHAAIGQGHGGAGAHYRQRPGAVRVGPRRPGWRMGLQGREALQERRTQEEPARRSGISLRAVPVADPGGFRRHERQGLQGQEGIGGLGRQHHPDVCTLLHPRAWLEERPVQREHARFPGRIRPVEKRQRRRPPHDGHGADGPGAGMAALKKIRLVDMDAAP